MRMRRVRMSKTTKAKLLTNKRQKWRFNAYKAQQGHCFYCSVEMVLEPQNSHQRHRECTLDHKLPLSRGGIDHWENSVAACSKCNRAKGDMTVEEFAAARTTPAPIPHDGEKP